MPRSSGKLIRPRRRSRIVRDVVVAVSITLGLLYLIRLIDCRSTLPDSRVVVLVYDQTTDSFSIETKPIPWWSVRKLSSKIEVQTIDTEGKRDGLYPHPRFRSREIVDYPDPTMDAHHPGYILSEDLPLGKALGPTQEWKMVSGMGWSNGQWNLEYESVHLNDTDAHRPIRVLQFQNFYPAKSPDENRYDFYIKAMGSHSARGLMRSYYPTIGQRIRHAMSDVIELLQ